MPAVFTSEVREETKVRIYATIKHAAQLGQKCPSLRSIGNALGIDHKTITRAVYRMAEAGLLEVRSKSIGRPPVIYVPEIGKATAEPKPRAVTVKPSASKGKFRLFLVRGLEAKPADTDAAIYGSIADDVRWLRHRGWVINRERPGVFRVGNSLLGAADIVAKAARERRLAGVA